jgi:hypothetical protein
VAYGNITGLLIEAVKELTARVAALEKTTSVAKSVSGDLP